MDPIRKRRLTIAGALIVTTVLLLATGVHRLLAGYLVRTLAPWMHAQAVAGTRELPADAVLQEQVCRLNALNVELRRRIADYEDVEASGGLLPPLTTIRARILSRSMRGRHYVEIDVGAIAGVRRHDPVIAGWSLVGLVAGEQSRRSLVQLLTDMECRVPAAIFRPPAEGGHPAQGTEDRWVADCIVLGTGRWDRLAVDHLEPTGDIDLEPGMHVLTSGIDGRIPPGLVIGTIADAPVDPDALTDRREVIPLRPWGTYHSLLILVREALPVAE